MNDINYLFKLFIYLNNVLCILSFSYTDFKKSCNYLSKFNYTVHASKSDTKNHGYEAISKHKKLEKARIIWYVRMYVFVYVETCISM